VEVSFPEPAALIKSKRGRKPTPPDPKRRRLEGPSRCNVRIGCIDQPEDNISPASSRHVPFGEEDAMQALLVAVEHAVSFGQDQQLDSATLASRHEGDEGRAAVVCETNISMWDDRFGELLDLEGSLFFEDHSVIDGVLGMWDDRMGEPLDIEGQQVGVDTLSM
jgi:hypothetical protein